MTLVATQQYIKLLLNDLPWPPGMAALPNPPGNLIAHATAPNPTVVASAPHAYIWMQRGAENRDNAKYGAGTIPRAQYAGGPSGTKAREHTIPIYVIWDGFSGDTNAATLFPGMLDAIMSALRVSPDPVEVTDPWDGSQSFLVDVGETISYDVDLWTLEPQRMERWDGLITCSVVEVFSA